jgi:hypothetical protein
MEKTICFVVGLPGSGKTGYLEQLQKSGFMAINKPADFDKDILPHLTGEGQVFAIADHSLCFPSFREKMVVQVRTLFPDVIFRWIYFENDPIQCISNLRAQGGAETQENLVWQVSQGYSIPGNIETKPVARPDVRSNKTFPSYSPGLTDTTTFKLVRVMDDLVIYSSADWDRFRQTVMYILQKYPTHRYRIVEEMITRNIKEIVFDRLIG